MSPLIPETDYYLDAYGRVVFTETYHLKRGYCCGNNCRHCPYNHENVTEKNRKEKPGEKDSRTKGR